MTRLLKKDIARANATIAKSLQTSTMPLTYRRYVQVLKELKEENLIKLLKSSLMAKQPL